MIGDDAQRAWDTIAENKIRTAYEEGFFDNLPGLGQPIEDLGALGDPHWWIREKLKREQLRADAFDLSSLGLVPRTT
jgi:hypothetical protein